MGFGDTSNFVYLSGVETINSTEHGDRILKRCVSFDPIDNAIVSALIEMIDDYNRRHNREHYLHGPSARATYQRMGYEAEVAFHKMIGRYPAINIATGWKSQGTDHGDLVYKDKRVDVKVTDHLNGNLIWNVGLPVTCDYAALIIKQPGQIFRLAGFASKDQILGAQVARYMPSPAYAVPQRELLQDI